MAWAKAEKNLTLREADVLRTGQRGAKNQVRLRAKNGQELQRTQLTRPLVRRKVVVVENEREDYSKNIDCSSFDIGHWRFHFRKRNLRVFFPNE